MVVTAVAITAGSNNGVVEITEIVDTMAGTNKEAEAGLMEEEITGMAADLIGDIEATGNTRL
jgi:hypothetical protein